MENEQLYLFGSQGATQRHNGRWRLTLTLDRLILFTVVIVILMTLVFALGLERGKRIAQANLQRQKAAQPDEVLSFSIESSNVSEVIEPAAAYQPEPEVLNDKKGASDQKEDRKRKAFRIQVASYYKEKTALKEAENLKAKGYPVIVLQKGKFIVLYVGSFDNEKEANSKWQTLKKSYKDCLLRRL